MYLELANQETEKGEKCRPAWMPVLEASELVNFVIARPRQLLVTMRGNGAIGRGARAPETMWQPGAVMPEMSPQALPAKFNSRSPRPRAEDYGRRAQQSAPSAEGYLQRKVNKPMAPGFAYVACSASRVTT